MAKRRSKEYLYSSRLLYWLLSLPLLPRFMRMLSRLWMRRRIRRRPVYEPTVEGTAAAELETVLQTIVEDVVNVLGYTGAMVATYEQGDTLPARAIYVDPLIATEEDIHKWEEKISEIAGHPVSITDPEIARVYVYDEAYQDNLSVKAVRAGGPVTSDELYDLFTPIAPPASKPLVGIIQQILGVRQVIAVPFFLETRADGKTSRELVGNLFAAKRSSISRQDILVLSAFGRQAAAAIGSERRRIQVEITQKLVYRVQTSLHDEQQILNWIVRGVVSDLGYVGAIVAPYERDGSLPIAALYVDPHVATADDLRRWEAQLAAMAGKPIRITDPNTARVYIHREACQQNLSVRAAKLGKPITTHELYDLFIPIVPPKARPLVQEIQRALGIRQLVAIPFFLETPVDGKPTRQLVGNLFAATRSRAFQASEIELLRAFGQQAAAGIYNARLYRTAEERRQAAQMFGTMAFSATTAVHVLANHIGVFQMHLELLKNLPPERREQALMADDDIQRRLQEAAELLNTLREPWRPISDKVVDVNACLRLAVDKTMPLWEEKELNVQIDLTPEPLEVRTSPEMLTEAFRVLIKNAIDAIQEKGHRGELRITSRRSATGIEVTISDNGVGIKPEHIPKIFEIGWSTKRTGLGFGLFWTRDYIEGLGGTIRVESAVGQGTTFYIHLPFDSESPPSPSQNARQG